MKKSAFVFGSVLVLTLLVMIGNDVEAKKYSYQYQYQYQYQTPTYSYQYQYQTPAGGTLPTLTVSPTTIAPGQTLSLTLNVNGGRTWPTVWFVKGNSETALSSWAFPCFQMCFSGMVVSTNYTIPSTWANGTDYYAKVYDHISGKYIKTNFTVGQ